jgi:hypothetical protein
MKKAIVFLALLAPILLSQPGLASYPAASRAVYYAGARHYISLNEDQQVGYYKTTNEDYSWDDAPVKYVQIPSGYKRLDANDEDYGQGIVLNGSMLLHYAVVWGPSSTPYLMMSRFDLTTQSFTSESPKIDRQLSTTGRKGYGVAAVLFSGTIYVFTSAFSLWSADGGGSYGQNNAIVPTSMGAYEPLDALTFTPGTTGQLQKVLLAFAKDNADGAIWVTWDAHTNRPLQASSFKPLGLSTNSRTRAAAMIAGTAGGPYYGKKVPVVSVYTLTEDDGPDAIHRCEYDVNADAMTTDPHTVTYKDGLTIDRLRVWPWSYPLDADPKGRVVTQQWAFINYYACDAAACANHSWVAYHVVSDAMVPQNQDATSGGYNWSGLPTATDTTTDPDLWKYWTMIGVIMGPAPFALNGVTSVPELKGLSNVEYGIDVSHQVGHSTSWGDSVMVSSGTEIKTGFLHESIDLSYKHSWEGSNDNETTCSNSLEFTCGTETETTDEDWGTHGWAIFAVPVMLVQDMKLYAYDYNAQTMTGTALDQDLTIVSVAPNSVSLKSIPYELDDPGGAPGYAGLLDGMAAQPLSTDLVSWKSKNWDSATSWEIKCGPQQVCRAASLVQGTSTSSSFGTSTSNVASTGSTDSFDVSIGVSFGKTGKLLGIHESLTAGYAGEWSTETTTSTEVSQDIQIEWNQANASCAGCTSALQVQPYLLRANSYSNPAPWVPAGYSRSLPWCMTWHVKSYSVNATGYHVGKSPLPGRALGTINPRRSSYAVEGGQLQWERADGSLEPIPLTAAGFDPALGAVVTLNGYDIALDRAHGKWTRYGDLWVFKSKASARKDVVTVKLDFGDRTWSLEGDKLRLADRLPAGVGLGRLELSVNGKYEFWSDVPHRVHIAWEVPVSEPDSDGLALSFYSGVYDTEGGQGTVLLEGRLPTNLEGFGDVSFVLNGSQVDIPLRSTDGLQEAFERRGEVSYHEGGAHVNIDFNRNTWSARFAGEAFRQLMAPGWGRSRISIKLGGGLVYDKVHPVLVHRTKLSYEG